MALRFSPKILGLNAGILGTVFRLSRTDFQFVIGLVCCFCVLLLEKRNNMPIL